MDEADSKVAASQKLAHFSDKKDLVKALDTTNAELLYIGTSLCSFPHDFSNIHGATIANLLALHGAVLYS